ncbi:hypothetical protein AGMMS50256_24220 [Betaproteobacteria bacterium]|nr:hypothetical protein AGMMS50256_24220 [Betaproteobacteria bacterium]
MPARNLAERYAVNLHGVLSCFDRIIIVGTLPGACYVQGMTSFLYQQRIRIFDYARFAEPLCDRIRERARQACADAGIEIEHVSKSHIRKREYRLDHARPIVDAFFAWVRSQLEAQGLLPSNPLTKALAYAQKRKAALEVFLTDPDVPIDTNHLEHALHSIPMGRKNWLFSWTELGAQHVGMIQPLIATYRLHEVDPYEYLVDVLQRVG